ncbi:MAG: DUF3524 domain-containing protein [Bacteroidia bacterium]|nr:DUF3524 domain-containing protein [Bacteroidia bacterium]
MKVLILLPYAIDSHLQWANGLKEHSRHEIEILSLSGNHWKWRMHGAGLTFAKRFGELEKRPDLIIATDMMDLSSFVSMLRKELVEIPVLLYFHENQLTYPWSKIDKDVGKGRDRHYAWINYASAMVADHVLFNSVFHQESFLKALPKFLKAFPDHQDMGNVEIIRQKSSVQYPGISLKALEVARPSKKMINEVPIILWNHRWEYDKNPEGFFEQMYFLQKKELPFKLVVLGRQFSNSPTVFNEAREKLKDHILEWGFVESREKYFEWIWKADVLAVSSFHDFFGISVLEAVYAGNYPILPYDQAYPEHFPPEHFSDYFYSSKENFSKKLEKVLLNRPLPESKLAEKVAQYELVKQVGTYDDFLDKFSA